MASPALISCAGGLACVAALAGGCRAAPAGFLLHAAPAPASWRTLRIPSGAVLSIPPGWHRVSGDAGTATAVTTDVHGAIVGYLNVTPREGAESAVGWASFRVRHNQAEGEGEVRRETAAARLRFRTGTGTCVRDSYTTLTGARYIEIACLVSGARATSVIVGAARPREWGALSPSLERAIGALST